jgi:dipeptidyl aminopeptidase/acylaminoacyl peptidase
MRSVCHFFSLILAASLAPAAAAQKTPPAKAFGQRESVQQVAMSPDGNRIAYIAPYGGAGAALYTVDLASGSAPQRVFISSGAPERLTWCQWVANNRLVCSVYFIAPIGGRDVASNRLVAINSDGTDMKLVSVKQGSNAIGYSPFGGAVLDFLPNENDSILVGRAYVPEERLGTKVSKSAEGYGVDRIDTRSLKTSQAVTPNKEASVYVSDGQGNVRIMGLFQTKGFGFDTGITKYRYRDVGSKDWKVLGDYDGVNLTGFYPAAVDPVSNAAIGFERINGRLAVSQIALNASLSKNVLFSHPEVDVDQLITVGRKQRVVGVSYATDYRHAHYFDQSISKLLNSLAKALPGADAVDLVAASSDESVLLLRTSGDVDPGQYYRFDKKSKQLSPLLAVRPELEDYKLAVVKPISYKAGDGTSIPGYLTLPPGSTGKKIPAIVMPHGGPSARDEWGFDWLAQFLANRGFAVLQPNYRGSDGYGDAWFRNKGFQAWNVAIGDVNDAGRWLVNQGIADPSKIAIVGWSYGGYAALQSAVVDPDLFKAIIAIAPVTDLGRLKDESRDSSDFGIVTRFVGNGPHVNAGSPAQHSARIKAPVLMFHGDKDLNVNINQSRNMAGNLSSAGKVHELVVYPNLDHSLDDSKAREEMLSKSEAFLRKSLGM